MIKSILVHKWVVLAAIMVAQADVTIQSLRKNGPFSYETVQRIFKENPGETIIFEYRADVGIFEYCKNIFTGDFSGISTVLLWSFKKGISIACMPTTITYCTILYGIYRVYKVISGFQSFFLSYSTGSDDHLLVNQIQTMLYKKVVRKKRSTRKTIDREVMEEKKKLYLLLKRYQMISSYLEFLGMRGLFWYNPHYEITIAEVLSCLESQISLPNFQKKLY